MNTPGLRRADRMPDGTPEVPVAIVGAGACGLTAALQLRDAGIDCVLLVVLVLWLLQLLGLMGRVVIR